MHHHHPPLLAPRHGKAVPGYTRFSVRDPWRTSVVYHLVYHRTLALHANHLVFLHTYLLGMLLALAASSAPTGLAAGAVLALFEVVFARGAAAGWSHACMCVAPLTVAAWWLSNRSLLAGWKPIGIAALGLALALASLLSQVAGHKLWEEFEAPAAPAHGLLFAPVLEWAAMWLRIRPHQTPWAQGVWQEVAHAREQARAGAKHSHWLGG